MTVVAQPPPLVNLRLAAGPLVIATATSCPHAPQPHVCHHLHLSPTDASSTVSSCLFTPSQLWCHCLLSAAPGFRMSPPARQSLISPAGCCLPAPPSLVCHGCLTLPLTAPILTAPAPAPASKFFPFWPLIQRPWCKLLLPRWPPWDYCCHPSLLCNTHSTNPWRRSAAVGNSGGNGCGRRH